MLEFLVLAENFGRIGNYFVGRMFRIISDGTSGGSHDGIPGRNFCEEIPGGILERIPDGISGLILGGIPREISE